MKNKLAEIRKKKGLTQKELAAMTGLSRPYISNLEHNMWEPKRNTMEIIAKALKTAVQHIFFS